MFVGGAIGGHNPTRELLKEAITIFGDDRRVAQVISLGCGVPSALSLESMTKETGMERLLKEIPADCQMVAKDLAARLYSVDAYLRLSVEGGIGILDMDQWGMLGDVEMHTACYIETKAVASALESSLECLKRRTGAVTLAHLSESFIMRQSIEQPLRKRLLLVQINRAASGLQPRKRPLYPLTLFGVSRNGKCSFGTSSRHPVRGRGFCLSPEWEAAGRRSWSRTSYNSTPLCTYITLSCHYS
jgi:hypothetical protein